MNIKGFSTLVTGMATAVQASAAGLVDFTIGSILRAVVEAFAQVVLWLQGLVLALLATTRAATSSGADLDSFMADYGLTRLAAVAAPGQVTFSRFTTTGAGIVPVGILVATADGSQQFAVTVDTGNPAYSAGLGGYVLAIGVASVTVTATASVAGSGGNVAAGAISIIVSEAPGIDSVTNAAAFTGGQDAETDTALRNRFRAFLRSLRTSNDDSINYAIANVQAGIRFQVVQNKTYPEMRDAPGYFFVAVDDGSGNPPQLLLDNVAAAISAVRGCGIWFGVFAPTGVTVNVAMTIAVNDLTLYAAAVSTAEAVVAAFINALPMQTQTLPLTRLAQVAYDAHTAITNVTAVIINGVASDFALTAFQVPEAGTIAVS